MWGVGCGGWGMGAGVWGLGSGVWGLGFGVWGLGAGVWGGVYRTEDTEDAAPPPPDALLEASASRSEGGEGDNVIPTPPGFRL